ncbi:unnamed protein product [Soboliphyme baturini]|uniref:Uncharacterized protein n=1 Tax=Soboliphyme baturini TaxID=241478 RepID=A0A183IFR9_9BILA|nr:unnamed protein product [Soboliphyme baturini]
MDMSRCDVSVTSGSPVLDISNSNAGDQLEEGTWAWPILSVNMDNVDHLLAEPFVQKLFRLFLFFVDPSFCDAIDETDLRPDPALSTRKTITGQDTQYFCYLLSQYIVRDHLMTAHDNEVISARVDDRESRTFKDFIQTLSDVFPIERTKIEGAIDTLYDKLVKQLFKTVSSHFMNDSCCIKSFLFVVCLTKLNRARMTGMDLVSSALLFFTRYSEVRGSRFHHLTYEPSNDKLGNMSRRCYTCLTGSVAFCPLATCHSTLL